jgi:hypothetical protein
MQLIVSAEVSLKLLDIQYERDEEMDSIHGARYYASWVGDG